MDLHVHGRKCKAVRIEKFRVRAGGATGRRTGRRHLLLRSEPVNKFVHQNLQGGDIPMAALVAGATYEY